MKFPLFCTPYYLEIFSVYSLLLDVTVPNLEIEKNNAKGHYIDYFKLYIQTGNAQHQ